MIAFLTLTALSILFSYGTASYYSTEQCQFNPNPDCPTASGRSLYELERKGELFAASWYHPIGTRLKITNVSNGKSVIVTVLDRGPNERSGRLIDLGRDAFREIADLRTGLINVEISRRNKWVRNKSVK